MRDGRFARTRSSIAFFFALSCSAKVGFLPPFSAGGTKEEGVRNGGRGARNSSGQEEGQAGKEEKKR